jgi:lipopolysaccharide biosynthesis glycosyltransferase
MLGPIVFACDEGYAMPLATALRSIIDANRTGCALEFHVLFDKFSERARTKVSNSLPAGTARIHWAQVNLDPYRKFDVFYYASRMTFARFLIPSIFPNSVTRVLYLDPDILVLDDLRALRETDLEGAVLGAVEDHIDRLLKVGEPGLERVPRVHCYFNAGVLLIDVAQWRKERISEKALDYLKNHPQSPYADQDALNVACNGNWKKLDVRWNFHDRHDQEKLAEMTSPPGIVHFVARLKPWKLSSNSLNYTFYDSFRSRTAFARTNWDKLSDLIEFGWFHLKRALKRSRLLTSVWAKLKRRPLSADPGTS